MSACIHLCCETPEDPYHDHFLGPADCGQCERVRRDEELAKLSDQPDTPGRMKATNVCRHCRAPIFFAITKNGKRMPIDPEPNDGGNVNLLQELTQAGDHYAIVVAKGAGAYMPHFATCKKRARR